MMRSEEWVEEFFEFFAILILAEELVEVQSPAADDRHLSSATPHWDIGLLLI